MAATSDPGRLRRVVVISDYAYPSGGIEHFVEEFLRAADSRYEVRLLSWTSRVRTPPGFGQVTTIDNGDFRTAWALMDWADVLLIPTSFNIRLLAGLVDDYLGRHPKPAVTVVHTSSHSDPTAAARTVQEERLTSLLDRSRLVVAVSDTVAAAVSQLHTGMPSTRLIVIENGSRLSVTARPIRTTRTRVSFIGRPFPAKGFPDFLRLARDLRGRGLQFHANAVSVPFDPVPHEVEASSLLPDDELLEFFARTDLLVVPYRFADGLPMAVLEALNCGVPIVGYDSPGVADLLRAHGQIVIPADYGQLRRTVEDWQRGAVHPLPPPLNTVPPWTTTLDRYFAEIDALEV